MSSSSSGSSGACSGSNFCKYPGCKQATVIMTELLSISWFPMTRMCMKRKNSMPHSASSWLNPIRWTLWDERHFIVFTKYRQKGFGEPWWTIMNITLWFCKSECGWAVVWEWVPRLGFGRGRIRCRGGNRRWSPPSDAHASETLQRQTLLWAPPSRKGFPCPHHSSECPFKQQIHARKSKCSGS